MGNVEEETDMLNRMTKGQLVNPQGRGSLYTTSAEKVHEMSKLN